MVYTFTFACISSCELPNVFKGFYVYSAGFYKTLVELLL